jgi:hypothetical protein
LEDASFILWAALSAERLSHGHLRF